MKKFFYMLILTLAVAASVFAEKVKLNITELENYVSTHFFYSEPCTIELKNNFKPKDVTESQLNAIASFLKQNPDNKLEGPILYIYYNNTHSQKDFYEIRKQIENSPDKYVCVDISSSYYLSRKGESYKLPANCFSGHKNLYWVNCGSFLGCELPVNFLNDCKNLLFVRMWNYADGNSNPTCFKNSNPNLKIINDYGESLTLKEFYENKNYFVWDYLEFDETNIEESEDTYYDDYDDYDDYDYDEYEDDDYDQYDDDSDESVFSALKKIYFEEMEEIKLEDYFESEEPESFTLSSAEEFLDGAISFPEEGYTVAKLFLAEYLTTGESAVEEVSSNEDFKTILDLEELEIFFGSDLYETEYDGEDTAEFSFIITGKTKDENNETKEIKDFGTIFLEKKDGSWKVTDFNTFLLMTLIIYMYVGGI